MTEQANEKLEEQCRALLNRVDELSTKLYRVNKRLHDAEALKGHFISNIANEIVNPFSSITALAENIQHLKETQMNDAKNMASMIYSEAFHLDFQLKNIFAAAEVEAGLDNLKPVSVNIENLFHKAIQFFKKQSDQKYIKIELRIQDQNNELTSFVTDEAKLELIVKNLLHNAIKYSFDSGMILIDVKKLKNELFCKICDSGKGINGEKKQFIFDRFKQLDERINSINTGHGLGLSIVSAYLNLLDGKIELSDNGHQGTCFGFSIKELDKDDDWEELDQFLIDPEETF
ncbi:HAMP domain-containing sensor histidine kinase [uncultured Sunxiuqinia sp.]|uniref:sensor histidine kinase n=1 Tax=uncultured Sunxiuqinia sp. TaxID=1573825 RepID=UPI002AA6CF7D|nr:HAMP domain-containing sensor histidine kinase [uncultured Sunxiuqinia sp.]